MSKKADPTAPRVKGLDEVARIKDVIDLCNELMARHIHARHIPGWKKWWWRVTGRYSAVTMVSTVEPVEEEKGQQATGHYDAAGQVVRAD
jgi:hypothetical protein